MVVSDLYMVRRVRVCLRNMNNLNIFDIYIATIYAYIKTTLQVEKGTKNNANETSCAIADLPSEHDTLLKCCFNAGPASHVY